jgi:transmembrane sensor
VSSASPRHTALFNKFLAGELSSQEEEELIAWLGEANLPPEAARLIRQRLQQPVAPEEITPAIGAALEARLPLILNSRPRSSLLYSLRSSARLHSLRTHRVRYAAAIILLLGVSAYLWLKREAPPVTSAHPYSAKNDLPPGKNGAILTLADGKTVVLDSLGNGIIATQNGSKVLLKNGTLAYKAEDPSTKAEDPATRAEEPATAAVMFNTMTTPRGRQFRLTLPDGTKVWLNAASSLRYPTQFNGNERKVEVTGEAYFEVARNINLPFIVKVNEATEIRVLGTRFNVNSYQDEATVNTTLLEGSVRISYGGEKAILQLAQQAQVNKLGAGPGDRPSEKIKILNDVNVEKVIAWKNGVFDFEDASLEEVMRQLERWYDIEVVYEKNIPPLEFIGKMGRDLTLSNVLRGLELSKVHFRMEGSRRLVILP